MRTRSCAPQILCQKMINLFGLSSHRIKPYGCYVSGKISCLSQLFLLAQKETIFVWLGYYASMKSDRISNSVAQVNNRYDFVVTIIHCMLYKTRFKTGNYIFMELNYLMYISLLSTLAQKCLMK